MQKARNESDKRIDIFLNISSYSIWWQSQHIPNQKKMLETNNISVLLRIEFPKFQIIIYEYNSHQSIRLDSYKV